MNLTNQEWECWKSSWARYKRYTGLTDQRNSVYKLWGCFSQELEMLDGENRLGDSEEQFLKRV